MATDKTNQHRPAKQQEPRPAEVMELMLRTWEIAEKAGHAFSIVLLLHRNGTDDTPDGWQPREAGFSVAHGNVIEALSAVQTLIQEIDKLNATVRAALEKASSNDVITRHLAS